MKLFHVKMAVLTKASHSAMEIIKMKKSHLESNWKATQSWNSYTFCFDISHSKLLRILSLLCENVPFLIFFYFIFFICFTGGKEFGNADISHMRYFKLYLWKLCLQVHWVRLGSLHPAPPVFQKTCWKISKLNNTLTILKAKLTGYVFLFKSRHFSGISNIKR